MIRIKPMHELLEQIVGFNDYSEIMKRFKSSKNLCEDGEFQVKFDCYYRVRRGEEWRKQYYRIFEKHRKKDAEKVTFKEIIEDLYDIENHIEASFASKMLATINCDKPIWDQFVLKKLSGESERKTKLKESGDKEERLDNAIKVYGEIEKWYENFLRTDLANELIENFDETFPNYIGLSKVKKIDFYLWADQSTEDKKSRQKDVNDSK